LAKNCIQELSRNRTQYINIFYAAKQLDDQFLEVPSKAKADSSLHDENLPIQLNTIEAFSLHRVRETDVQKVIQSLKTNKAIGHDGIATRIIKGAKSLVKHITKLINLSIDTSIVPENMKIAKVTPLRKNGPVKEFRPVAVLPILSKILEKVIVHQVLTISRQTSWSTKDNAGSGKAAHVEPRCILPKKNG
jgi:hypothetical protein